MPITRSKASEILNGIFQKTYYIGLSTTTPTATGGNFNEPTSSTGYKRMQLSAMGSASDGQIQNTDIIFFPESLSTWGKITYFGIFTASSGSTAPIYYGEIKDTSGVLGVDVPQGYVPLFRSGALKVALDREVS